MFQKLWLFSNWLKFLLTYFRLNPKSQNSPGLSKFPLMVFVWIQVKRETYIQDMPTENPEWERGHTQTHNPEWESPLKLQSLSRREQSTVTCKTLSETAIHGMKYMDISENYLTIHMEVELLSTLKMGKTILMTPNVLEICFQQTATFQK